MQMLLTLKFCDMVFLKNTQIMKKTLAKKTIEKSPKCVNPNTEKNSLV